MTDCMKLRVIKDNGEWLSKGNRRVSSTTAGRALKINRGQRPIESLVDNKRSRRVI